MSDFCNGIVLTLPLILTLLFSATGLFTVEYAQQTGKNCSDCHVNPAGGGELAKTGEAFKEQLHATKKPMLFYFMAYMNLSFVFVTVFIICLW